MADSDYIAIAAGDLHLDEHAWADRRNIYGDSMWSFQWITDLAMKKDLPLLFAGDVLDRQLNNATLAQFLRERLAVLDAANISIFFIQGQHDMQPCPWLSSLGRSCVHAHDYTAFFGSTDAPIGMYGIDWTPATGIKEALAKIPEGTGLLMMHQVTIQLMQELGETKIYELDVMQIPHAKLLILGDFHRHRIISTRGSTGNPLTVLSTGSTNMRSIDEPGEKYVFLIKRDLTFDRLRIPTRPKLEVEIREEKDLGTVLLEAVESARKAAIDSRAEGVPDHISKPLLRVRFDPNIPLAYKRIEEAIGTNAHFFPSYVDGTKPKAVIRPEEAHEEQISDLGPVASLPQLVNKDREPMLFGLLQRLLTEQSPTEVLAAERAKYINKG